MKRFPLLFLALAATWAHGQADSLVKMDYSNPQLVPSHWTLTIRNDGSGRFRSESGQSKERVSSPLIEAPDVDSEIRLSPNFARHVFDVAHKKSFFNMKCESHLKVAFQGTKQLEYEGPEGKGACAFNYSKDKEIQELSDSLISVGTTLLEGARIGLLLQHDRLGLDRETQILSDSAADGRAQQIGSIEDILRRVVDDPRVMDRVKKRVQMLLNQVAQ